MRTLFNHLVLQIRQLLKMWSTPSTTIQYPFVSKQLSNIARSQFRLELSACTGCQDCEQMCPVKAIEVRFVDAMNSMGLLDEQSVRQIEVDYGRCVACGICVDVCEPNALKYSREEFPVGLGKRDLKVGLVKNKSLPDVARR